MKTTASIIIAALALALVSCRNASQPGLTQADLDEIEGRQQDLVSTSLAYDPEGRAALMAPDGVILPRNRAAIEGRDAFAAFLREIWSDQAPMSAFDLQVQEIEGSGELAISSGTYRFVRAGEETTGKFLQVWKRQTDGSWLLHRDLFNEDDGS